MIDENGKLKEVGTDDSFAIRMWAIEIALGINNSAKRVVDLADTIKMAQTLVDFVATGSEND